MTSDGAAPGVDAARVVMVTNDAAPIARIASASFCSCASVNGEYTSSSSAPSVAA